MKLTFYKFGGTPERIDKTDYLTTMTTIDGVKLVEDTDLMAPQFRLKLNNLVYQSNYVYCDTTDRYYYINDIQSVIGRHLIISCKIDVLHTYHDEILNSQAWIEKNESISDDEKFLSQDFPFREDKDTCGKDFPNTPFTNTSKNILVILTP